MSKVLQVLKTAGKVTVGIVIWVAGKMGGAKK